MFAEVLFTCSVKLYNASGIKLTEICDDVDAGGEIFIESGKREEYRWLYEIPVKIYLKLFNA